jgi:hypothetical protein
MVVSVRRERPDREFYETVADQVVRLIEHGGIEGMGEFGMESRHRIYDSDDD